MATLEQDTKNGDLIIPPDSYLAMGDNRDNSLDSRYWGFVPRQNMIGRPLFIFWSFDVPEDNGEPKPIPERISSFLHVATHFFTLTRWHRIFRMVH